jgi:hypothetical protein
MIVSNRQAAGLFYARKNNRSRAMVDALTPWSPGLAVTTGEYVQSFGLPYVATNSGTTGATAPNGTSGNISDGTITWQFVWPSSILIPPSTPA